MITEEERQSIINEAVEKALLALPEVIGNLITSHISMIRINREFYEKYPDLAKSKDIVSSVIEKVEGDNPGIDYTEILDRAVPIIREQIKSIRTLDVKTVTRPNRDLSSLNFGKGDHGEL